MCATICDVVSLACLQCADEGKSRQQWLVQHPYTSLRNTQDIANASYCRYGPVIQIAQIFLLDCTEELNNQEEWDLCFR